ncbi:MAG: signal peptidase I [Streptosporangiaceae bacterium]
MSGSDQDDASGTRDLGQVYRSDTGSWRAVQGSDSEENQSAQAEDQGEGVPGAAAAGSAADGDGDSPGSAAGSAPGGRRAKPRAKRSFWRELPILVAIALVLAVLIKTFAVQAFWIPSGSMENTLEINDRVLVNKIVYHLRDIHRGDIVVFNGDGSWDPGTIPVTGNVFEQFYNGFASMFGFGKSGDILIKRVIGIPGDHVACCDAQGRVTVNGVPLSEGSYLYPGSAPSLMKFSVVVPPGRLWVMGDNRLVSDDSRLHQGDPGGGTIPESAVVGRAFIIIWPPSRWRVLPIPATFEQSQLSASASASASASGSASASAASGAGQAAVLSAHLQSTGPALPLSLGFAAALPLTWVQRRVRIRAARRRAPRSGPGHVIRAVRRCAPRSGPGHVIRAVRRRAPRGGPDADD